MIIFALLLAVLPTYQLSWTPSHTATSYAIEKQVVLNDTIWTAQDCSAQVCSTRTYSPATGIVEQLRIRAIRGTESALSREIATLLTIDWSGGNANYSTYTGNGAMPLTLVQVMLPSPRWTVVYSYQGAIPVYVKATCRFDYNRDDMVDLIDFVLFMPDYIASGKNLSLLGQFGMSYNQQGTRVWQ